MLGKVINLDGRPDRLQQFYKQEFPFRIDRFRGIKTPRGEDGCTVSHLSAINSIKEFPTLICEDDCVLLHPWNMIEPIMSQLPENWDCLYLGANLQKPLERYSENLFILKKAYCLHAVIYNSPEMIHFILNNHKTPKGKNLDLFYHNVVQERFNCFITYPMCATQSAGVSNICGNYVEYTHELLLRYNKNTNEVHAGRL